MIGNNEILEALPIAAYLTDSEGRITFFNAAAAQMWGQTPDLENARWCGSWRLYWPDGTPMGHDECPMAIAIRTGEPVRGVEAILERPDGSRIPFVPHPTLLKDADGKIVGAINLLTDVSEYKHRHVESARLVSIIEGSDDAIISKTLEGRITSWNDGAYRIFGYTAEEMIGHSITRIIPPELMDEERELLAKLKRGERIDHFDTVRVAKDGRRVDISLTVSPIRDNLGLIVGASKIARDITDRKQAETLQTLLFEELNHRVKNTLATIQAIASQSLRRSVSPRDFVDSFNGRVQALARAHDLLVQGKMKGAQIAEILREQVMLCGTTDLRISCSGPFLVLDARAAVQLALVMHELATNARKYGALSVPEGRLAISWSLETGDRRELHLEWRESGVPNVSAPTSHGFGSTLIQRTLQANGGEAATRYNADGISCEIQFPLPDADEHALPMVAEPVNELRNTFASVPSQRSRLWGKRILLVEDEPLVGLEVGADLSAAGCEVVGPAATLKSAQSLIEETEFDAALIDANLAGDPVDEIASALARKGVPFAFATGYGRRALPLAFRHQAVLVKPFNRDQLLAIVESLFVGTDNNSPQVVSLHDKRVATSPAGLNAAE